MKLTDKVTKKEALKLRGKQELFCAEYLVDLNATRAAIRAGYSAKTAGQMGAENLKKPVVRETLQLLMAERAENLRIDAAWVLKEAKKSYELNATSFSNQEGADEMVNAAAAGKFLEMCGKHVAVKAFDKETQVINNNNIMPIPTADSVEDWEKQAQAHQDKLLNGS
jgi:phage terminase small subunit